MGIDTVSIYKDLGSYREFQNLELGSKDCKLRLKEESSVRIMSLCSDLIALEWPLVRLRTNICRI